jgi:peptidoglycan hydrolase CwlO-like protein
MISYDQVRGIILSEASYNKMRDWVFDKMENSNMDIDQMRDAFAKKYGKQNVKHMEKAVNEYEGMVNENTGAQKELDDKLKEIKSLMSSIQRNVKKMSALKKVDYGDVGSAGKVLTDLKEVDRFLSSSV